MVRYQPAGVIGISMVYGLLYHSQDPAPLAPLSVALLACLVLCGRPLLLLPWMASVTVDSLALFAVPSRMADGMDLPLFAGCLGYLTDSSDHRLRTRYLAFLLLVRHLTETGHLEQVVKAISQRCWTISLQSRTVFLLTTTGRLVTAVCCCIYLSCCVVHPFGEGWVTPIQVMKCVFKRRVDNIRPFLIALYTVFFFYCILSFGISFYFPRHLASLLKWSSIDTGALCGLLALIQGATVWFTSSRPDLEIGILGSLSLVISCFLLSLASTAQMAFVGAVAGLASLLLPASALSILSKLIERNETGRLYAGVGFLMVTSHLVSMPFYQVIEKMCEEAKMPQGIFLLLFVFSTFELLFYIYLQRSVNPELLGHLEICESLQLLTNDHVEPLN